MSQFETAPMSRLVLAGTHAQLPDVLAAASRLRAIHLIDHADEDDVIDLGRPLDGADATSRRVSRLRTAVAQLRPKAPDEQLAAPQVRADLDGRVAPLVEDVLAALNERDQAVAEIEQMEDDLAAFERLAPLGLDLELLRDYEHLEVMVGRPSNIARMREALIPHTNVAIEVSSEQHGGVMAIFVKRAHVAEVQEVISGQGGFESIAIPDGTGRPETAAAELRQQVAARQTEVDALEVKLAAWREADGGLLLGGLEVLERDLDVQTAPVRLGMSARAFVLDGWVHTARADEVRSALEPLVCHMDVEDVPLHTESHGHGHHDEVTEPVPPTAFVDRGAAKPLELITDLVGRPKYGRIDPTSFMLITYPIFFGMMLGDIAFGLFTIALGLWLGTNKGLQRAFGDETQKQASRLVMYIGIATVLFGFWYAEFLGFEITGTGSHAPPAWVGWMSFPYDPFLDHGHGPELHLPFEVVLAYPMHRVGHNMLDLMLITIYLGAFHLMLGYIIGFIDVMRGHSLAAAFFEKASWMIVLVGGFLFVFGFMDHGGLPPGDWNGYQFTGIGILAIGLPVLMVGLAKYEGFGAVGVPLALLECVSLLSNTLSYVRLFAIGVAGVKIAEVGNELGYHNFEHLVFHGHGAGDIFIGLLAFVLWVGVFIFAWVLGVFSPNIHTARLHFVEWMGKFYDGSAERFAPFGPRQRVVEFE